MKFSYENTDSLRCCGAKCLQISNVESKCSQFDISVVMCLLSFKEDTGLVPGCVESKTYKMGTGTGQ